MADHSKGVSHAPQHDDHCWLVFEGAAWRIVGVAGGGTRGQITLRATDADGLFRYASLLLPAVRWDDYVAAATGLLEGARG